jgi:uncharacterized protein (TIGR00299 family) protein
VRVAHLEPLSGASGDMLLGAAVDAGADLDVVVGILGKLALDGWALRADSVTRGGIAGTSVVLLVADDSDGVVRTWGNVRSLIEQAPLPPRVRARSIATFSRIAEVEAQLSRRDVQHVHFHDVGALDAIIDVVGTCAALDLLGIERVTCGPVAQGMGMVRGEHGLHPVPGPAVLQLLAGAPTYGTGEPVELCTETGAALLAEWADAWGPMPPLTLRAVGYGAGTRELGRPNVLRLILGEAEDVHVPGRALLLTATVPGGGEDLLAALRAEGALDAWAVPLTDGRAAVTCVTPPETADPLRKVLLGVAVAVQGSVVERWTPSNPGAPPRAPAPPAPAPPPPGPA